LLFPVPLLVARFKRREKRFTIHGLLLNETGAEMGDVAAHTNNTGSMRGCLFPDGRMWLSPAANPARKLKYTLEIVETANKVLVGVNTSQANTLIGESIKDGSITNLAGFASVRSEVKYGSRNSRIDFLLENDTGQNNSNRVWVEVKNVSLVEAGHARFPDSPTERGRKHLLELQEMVLSGDRAALVFCIQRGDANTVGPADDIDPEYGKLLREVMAAGVEVYGVRMKVSPTGIMFDQLIPVKLFPVPDSLHKPLA